MPFARLILSAPHHELHTHTQAVTLGIGGSFAVVYTRETGAKVVEVFRLDTQGRAAEVEVFYDAVC